MSERFERLFSLPENLYADGAPIIISSGALLKDTSTGSILAKLMLKSVSNRQIKAVKVKLALIDTWGEPLDNELSYDYLDLSVQRDSVFGQNTEINIPNASARSFIASVSAVAYADNGTWISDGTAWTPLPKMVLLEDALGDNELATQFRLHYGKKATFQPIKNNSIWICSCGEANGAEEEVCHVCGCKADSLFSYDLEELKAEVAARVEQEINEKKAATAKKKKFVILGVAIALFLITIAVFSVTHHNKIEKEREIEEANALIMETNAIAEAHLNAGEYYDAICLYGKIGNADGIKQVLSKMGYGNAKRVAVDNKKTIYFLSGNTLYEFEGSKIVGSVSPQTPKEFDAFCPHHAGASSGYIRFIVDYDNNEWIVPERVTSSSNSSSGSSSSSNQKTATCNYCHGTGKVNGEKCPWCNGSGKTYDNAFNDALGGG